MCFPLVENDAAKILPPSPGKIADGCPMSASHTRAVWSALAVTMRFPSGENVAKFRNAAMAATSPAEKSEAEGQLTYALRGLLAVAEAYPQLRAPEQFQSLQGSLTGLEDAIQNARRYYNAVVRDLNTKIQTFPTNIVAGMFHIQLKQFFDITEPAQREPVAVKF